jgi:hypothetical protein
LYNNINSSNSIKKLSIFDSFFFSEMIHLHHFCSNYHTNKTLKPMYKIQANTEKNYLLIELKGFFNEEETKNAAFLAVEEGKKLKPGFTIINNISEFKPVIQESVKYLSEAQTAIFQMGAKRAVRVVGNVLAKAQFNRVQKEANVGYEVVEVRTVEEAMKFIL